MIEIRIAWKINGKSSGGLWRHDTPNNRVGLRQFIADANRKYGQGTHWIEERKA